jgi:hypothetical protein
MVFTIYLYLVASKTLYIIKLLKQAIFKYFKYFNSNNNNLQYKYL